MIRLNHVTETQILTLLQRLTDIYTLNFGYEQILRNSDLKEFVPEIINHLGAEALLTPGEIIRDFISVLNFIYQNPEMKLTELIQGANFKLILAGEDGD